MSCARRKAEPSSSPQLPTSLQLRLRRVQGWRSIILGLHDPGILPRGPVYMFESYALFVHTKGFLAGSDCDLICPPPNAFVSVGGRGPAPHSVDPEGKGIRGTDDSRRYRFIPLPSLLVPSHVDSRGLLSLHRLQHLPWKIDQNELCSLFIHTLVIFEKNGTTQIWCSHQPREVQLKIKRLLNICIHGSALMRLEPHGGAGTAHVTHVWINHVH